MKPKRVYIDTSVVGGCLDPEFRDASLELFERFRAGTMIAVVSDLVRSELKRAPLPVHAVLAGVPQVGREDVVLTDEARRLADCYLAAGVVGRSMRLDAQHVAAAVVHRVDVLASYDFKHMLNPLRGRGYNEVNLREGHPLLVIRTPAEVIAYGR
jgi:predicted nucleic acid-binding protein